MNLPVNPMGWSTTAGKTHNVAVTGTSMPINYAAHWLRIHQSDRS